MVLLLMVLALLVLGTFMDMAPLIIIATPIFLPVAQGIWRGPGAFRRDSYPVLRDRAADAAGGVGAVHRIAAIGKIDVAKAVKGLWPFYIAMLIVLLAVVLVPELSLTLRDWGK